MRASCTIQNKNWFFETPDIPYFLTWSGLFSFVKDSRDIGVGRGWGEGGGAKGMLPPSQIIGGLLPSPTSQIIGGPGPSCPPLFLCLCHVNLFLGGKGYVAPPLKLLGGGAIAPPTSLKLLGGLAPPAPPSPPPPPIIYPPFSSISM